LGTNVSVPTLTEPVNIKIPPGTQTGSVCGCGGAACRDARAKNGDLYAAPRIQMPPKITEREKELWEQLAQASSFDPRGMRRLGRLAEATADGSASRPYYSTG